MMEDSIATKLQLVQCQEIILKNSKMQPQSEQEILNFQKNAMSLQMQGENMILQDYQIITKLSFKIHILTTMLDYPQRDQFIYILANKSSQIQQNKLLRKKRINLHLNQNIVKQKIYRNFIIYVDANDNGVSKIDDKQVSGVPTTLWSRVGKLNPMWWEQNVNQFQLFKKAMIIADQELVSEVKGCVFGSLQTKSLVKDAFLARKNIHPSGRIVLLQKYIPWVKPIFQLQEQQNCLNEILFVIFPEKSGKKWRIQAVPVKQGAFELRKGIKEEWRGIKDQQKIVNLSGIYDIDFVHATGFIGGAVSKESTIKMAELSI